MVIVAVCDDEVKVCAQLDRTLTDIFNKLSVEHEIEVFFSGEDLCKKIEAGAHYDLIFLDIEFIQDAINGVEVGRFIRDINQNHMSSIVYISWVKIYAMQLFEIQPLNFLIKPLEDEKIDEVVRLYMKIAGFRSAEFTYKIRHDTFKARLKDIIYLESYDRKLILHLADGRKEEFYGSIKEAYQKQLERFDFLYIHNSYIVNYDYIATLKFNQVFLVGSSATLPVSKHRRNEIRERYYQIIKRRAV